MQVEIAARKAHDLQSKSCTGCTEKAKPRRVGSPGLLKTVRYRTTILKGRRFVRTSPRKTLSRIQFNTLNIAVVEGNDYFFVTGVAKGTLSPVINEEPSWERELPAVPSHRGKRASDGLSVFPGNGSVLDLTKAATSWSKALKKACV